MVTNLSEVSLVAKRTIKDHLAHVGGVLNVCMTKELFASARGAYHKYQQHLQEEKEKAKRPVAEKRRASLGAELDALKAKRKRVEDLISELTQNADNLAEEAEGESSQRMALLVSQSNALRKSAREKTAELLAIQKMVKQKEVECQSI